MIKNKTIIGLTIAGGLALAFASFAGAQTSTSTPAVSETKTKAVVQIGPEGKALLRGTVVSVSGSALTVQSWGGNWTVNVASGAEVLPAVTGVTATDLSAFKAGDFVGVQGNADATASWTINAKTVRDWTVKATENTNRKDVQGTEKSGKEQGVGRVFEGTASGVSGTSFSLAAQNHTFTVNAASATSILNRNWLTIGLSAIQNGDHVRVFGTADASMTTVTAQVVRDVTLPIDTATSTHE